MERIKKGFLEEEGFELDLERWLEMEQEAQKEKRRERVCVVWVAGLLPREVCRVSLDNFELSHGRDV